MKNFLIALVKIYQSTLSHLLAGLGGQCRFYPSCSEYFKMGLERYRLDRAFFLIIKRIFKCHPWHPGGVDFHGLLQPMGVVRVERQDAPPDFSERGFTPRERMDIP